MADNYTFSAEVIGGDELEASLKKAGEQASQLLADALNQTAYIIQPAAVAGAPADTGQLRASIHTEPASAKNLESKVGTNVKYAWPMETGTGPHMVPIAQLKSWAKRKLGDERLAYPVQKAIARNGIKGRKYMISAFQEKKDEFTKNVQKAIDAIMGIIRG
jgi:hypothetical protein